jgi:hypothetical protein
LVFGSALLLGGLISFGGGSGAGGASGCFASAAGAGAGSGVRGPPPPGGMGTTKPSATISGGFPGSSIGPKIAPAMKRMCAVTDSTKPPSMPWSIASRSSISRSTASLIEPSSRRA